MAVTERQERSLSSRIWAIGVRQVVFMALGAALYAGVSYATNSLQLPGASNVSLRPGIVIPVCFGVVCLQAALAISSTTCSRVLFTGTGTWVTA